MSADSSMEVASAPMPDVSNVSISAAEMEVYRKMKGGNVSQGAKSGNRRGE